MGWPRNDSAMTPRATSEGAPPAGHSRPAGPLHRWILPIRPPKPVNPALLKNAPQREEFVQNRIADAITAVAGSMAFVYIHILWFGCCIGLGVEHYPFGLLTMIVSLEAIFLSTFVMISQNRADTKRQVLADQQWRTVQEEDQRNKQLLSLTRQILALTQEVRGYAGLAKENHEQNEQLIDMTRCALALTTEVHAGKAGGVRTSGCDRGAAHVQKQDDA
jgi:uncharacterized membrane protein